MSTEDEFGTCNICLQDDWLTVDQGDWLCTDCMAERIIEQQRQLAAEEYERTMDYDA